MIVFPNAKINLGLNIIRRRSDGYHDLDMVMVPVGWRDILEIVPSSSGSTTLTTSGNEVNCPPEKNLVYKAWCRLNDFLDGDLAPVDMYLNKVIPDGAGLGGGSADAAFTLRALNSLFGLGLTDAKLCAIAAPLGADCPFFIHNRPMLCSGTGTDMLPVEVNFGSAIRIVIAEPGGVCVSTAEAYSGVTPSVPELTTGEIVSRLTPDEWHDKLFNGFEPHIFAAHPEIADVKRMMIASGAIYASMSGSGSAVYGLFGDAKMAEKAAADLKGCDIYSGDLASLSYH